jgi:catechol 2,3-dioxygenase-like lactoylglutathione lyase family enzyme
MKIKLTSVIVDDQDKALRFYTEVLGLVKKTEMPAGTVRWLTVVSPESPADVELALEPNENPAAGAYQRALYEAGIPLRAFAVDDIASDFERLTKRGVAFRSKPTQAGPAVITVFDDACGNLIMLYQS